MRWPYYPFILRLMTEKQPRIKSRCSWPGKNELMIRYHDKEWGLPCFDDRKLFEYVVLDTFQAGLSWAIVLNKREGFRAAFDNFEAARIAEYDEAKIQELILDPKIVTV